MVVSAFIRLGARLAVSVQHGIARQQLAWEHFWGVQVRGEGGAQLAVPTPLNNIDGHDNC